MITLCAAQGSPLVQNCMSLRIQHTNRVSQTVQSGDVLRWTQMTTPP